MSPLLKFFIILAVVIYVISPIDLIPDFLVPFLGWIDDTVLISILIYFLRTGKLPGIFSRKSNFQSKSSYFKSNATDSSQKMVRKGLFTGTITQPKGPTKRNLPMKFWVFPPAPHRKKFGRHT